MLVCCLAAAAWLLSGRAGSDQSGAWWGSVAARRRGRRSLPRCEPRRGRARADSEPTRRSAGSGTCGKRAALGTRGDPRRGRLPGGRKAGAPEGRAPSGQRGLQPERGTSWAASCNASGREHGACRGAVPRRVTCSSSDMCRGVRGLSSGRRRSSGKTSTLQRPAEGTPKATSAAAAASAMWQHRSLVYVAWIMLAVGGARGRGRAGLRGCGCDRGRGGPGVGVLAMWLRSDPAAS